MLSPLKTTSEDFFLKEIKKETKIGEMCGKKGF